MAGDSGVYSRGRSAQETDWICNDQRNALRDAKKGLTCSGRHMQRRKKNRNSGECSQPYKCRGNLSAALHMDAVLLTCGCSDPLYRRAARVSMGTVFQIPWTYFDKKTKWPVQGMESLSEMGYKTVAMALRNDSVEIRDPKLKAEEKLAIILGTEGEGLDAETMELCDYTVKIPMSHGVDSLNVAAASAVAFWELGQRS